ncbi:MAG: CapA family protein [Eubacteriales bacterium]|nr:CapA family protein [Eubacteriales bacterium]
MPDNKRNVPRKSTKRPSSKGTTSPKTSSRSGSAKRRPESPEDEERLRRIRQRRKREQQLAKRRQKYMILFGAGALVFCGILLLASVLSSIFGNPSGSLSSSAVTDTAKNSTMEEENNTEELTTEVIATTTPAPVSLTISVVGDCTLGTDVNFDYDTSLNNYYEMYGSSYFMQNVQSIFASDDLTIANFEGTLTESDERADKQFAFKAPASFASILTDGSIETVNTANNHSHDYGDQSFTDTLAALDSVGVVHFGYEETAVVDVKGVKVGLVGIYELNDHLDCQTQMKTNIATVKSQGAQLIIVIFHWGNEKEEMPDSNQTTLGRMAIDCGADLVCGHHPHVLQGIETYKGKNIVYSLGNFCFGGNSYPSDMDSVIYQQTFTVTGEEVASDNEVTLIPCSISSDYYYNNYQPTPAEDSEATRILEKIQERSAMIPTAASDSYNYFQRP